jgi:putative Mn2+ efflux pump MntP
MAITAIEIGFAVAVAAAGLLIARKGLDQRQTIGLFVLGVVLVWLGATMVWLVAHQ